MSSTPVRSACSISNTSHRTILIAGYDPDPYGLDVPTHTSAVACTGGIGGQTLAQTANVDWRRGALEDRQGWSKAGK